MGEDQAVITGTSKYFAHFLAPIATGAISVVGLLVMLMWNSVTDQIGRLDQRINGVQAAQAEFLRTAADRQMKHQADILDLIQQHLEQYQNGTKYEVTALHESMRDQQESTKEMNVRLVEIENLVSVLLPANGPINGLTPNILQGTARSPSVNQ
jgi:hypothetical protein